MRSIKNLSVRVLGVNLREGKYYVLEFPNRYENSEYIFEFAGISKQNNVFGIRHRNKVVVDNNFDNVMVFGDNELLVNVPCGEIIQFKKYRGRIL